MALALAVDAGGTEKLRRGSIPILARYWLDIGTIKALALALTLIKLKGAPKYYAGDYINTPREKSLILFLKKEVGSSIQPFGGRGCILLTMKNLKRTLFLSSALLFFFFFFFFNLQS